MSIPDFTLYLGGTRSGKSVRAEKRVKEHADGPVLYVATALALDDAMRERIRRHQARRPSNWRTLECPQHLGERLAEQPELQKTGSRYRNTPGTPTILIDCVTLWMSNVLFSLPDPENLSAFETAVRAETDALIRVMQDAQYRWVAVSGETGLGGIEATRLGRTYADGLGLANQLLAAQARETFLVIAGKTLRLED